MKEMIKKVRERREGFTMAELLIVVAIIAVLVAIAIPVFSAQLEKSKEATDMANIRTAYAEVNASWLGDNAAKSLDVALGSDTTNWKSADDAKIATVSAKTLIGSDSAKKTTITVAIDANGEVTIGDTKVAPSSATPPTTTTTTS